MTEDNRKDIVAYRIERANTALEQAKLNLQMNCLGNVTQFGLHFVKTGIADREDGKLSDRREYKHLKCAPFGRICNPTAASISI